ncbi:MAG: hypothetical protein ACREM1_09650 [Longimicrobiales bacterium]
MGNHERYADARHRLTVGLDYPESEGNTLDPWFEEPGREPERGGKSAVHSRS